MGDRLLAGNWNSSAYNRHASRGTGILNNKFYKGLSVWNKRTSRETGNRIFCKNPENQIVHKIVRELRIIPDDLWQAIKKRQDTAKLTF
ncbi:recombinase family protein [Acetobacter sp.]|uniref:recombinase family protein n=1 Tax=Acetobacter sp. TaxID=440 RepID=UPI0039ECD0B5